MKVLLTVALLTMAATSAFSADAKPMTGKMTAAKSDHAMTAAAEGFFAAWNQHDTKAMASFWADDATLINPMGRRAHGKAEIEQLLTDEQTSVFKASTAKLVELKVTRTLGPNLAFCDGEMTVDGALGADGAALPQMTFHLAVIMAQKGGHWGFAEARPYTFIAPPPGATKAN